MHRHAGIALMQSSPVGPGGARTEQARAARELTALLTGVTIVLIVFVVVAVLLLMRRRLAGPGAARRGRHPPPPSAWAEAGRRTPPSGEDDDTIDEDPRDLSAGDVTPEDGPGRPSG